MTEQRLKGRTVSPLKGFVIIVGIVLSIIVVSWLERFLSAVTGLSYFSYAVWVVIILEAAAVMRLSVMEYRYVLADGHFIVQRVYGDHARVVQDIPVEQIAAVGRTEDIFKRYGNGQSYEKAVMRQSMIEQQAIAYRKAEDDAWKLLVIQPDEAMKKALSEVVSRE